MTIRPNLSRARLLSSPPGRTPTSPTATSASTTTARTCFHENAYERDPGFRRFKDETGLAFQPHAELKKADMDARQDRYGNLAEQIWNLEILMQEVH